MESIPCELCGDTTYTVVRRYRRDKYFDQFPDARPQGRVVVCQQCGYVYQNPRWDARELELIYSEKRRDKQEPSPETAAQSVRAADEAAAWVEARLPSRAGRPGRFLDIGSGQGYHVRAFAERGWQAVGIEPRWSSCQYARRSFGVNIVQGYFTPALFTQPFDLVALTETLEHLPRPVEFLSRLRAGGL